MLPRPGDTAKLYICTADKQFLYTCILLLHVMWLPTEVMLRPMTQAPWFYTQELQLQDGTSTEAENHQISSDAQGLRPCQLQQGPNTGRTNWGILHQAHVKQELGMLM